MKKGVVLVLWKHVSYFSAIVFFEKLCWLGTKMQLVGLFWWEALKI